MAGVRLLFLRAVLIALYGSNSFAFEKVDIIHMVSI